MVPDANKAPPFVGQQYHKNNSSSSSSSRCCIFNFVDLSRGSLNLGEYLHAQSVDEVFFREKDAGGKSKLILKVKFYPLKKSFSLYIPVTNY